MDEADDLVAFCEAEYPRLVGVLGLYSGNRAVAEELAQETLARVWRHWPKVSRLGNPGAWARRVAINLAKSHLRRVALEMRVRRIPEDVSSNPAAATEDALEVRRAVAALPHRQKSALLLRFYLDLPFGEIAEVMDVPESTAKSLVRRGLARLRAGELATRFEEVPNAQ